MVPDYVGDAAANASDRAGRAAVKDSKLLTAWSQIQKGNSAAADED